MGAAQEIDAQSSAFDDHVVSKPASIDTGQDARRVGGQRTNGRRGQPTATCVVAGRHNGDGSRHVTHGVLEFVDFNAFHGTLAGFIDLSWQIPGIQGFIRANGWSVRGSPRT